MQAASRRLSKAIGTAVAMMAAGHAVAASAQGRTFSLPESNAVVALPEFARQAGVQIVAPANTCSRSARRPCRARWNRAWPCGSCWPAPD